MIAAPVTDVAVLAVVDLVAVDTEILLDVLVLLSLVPQVPVSAADNHVAHLALDARAPGC